MRRTLTVLVTAAALLVPATAASAGQVDRVKSNASCNSGQQRGPAGSTYNLKGNTEYALTGVGCGVVPPPPPPPVVPTQAF